MIQGALKPCFYELHLRKPQRHGEIIKALAVDGRPVAAGSPVIENAGKGDEIFHFFTIS
jgi:hypothetical protein